MILGLDVSTSIIGVCLLKDNKIVKADYIDLRKTTGLLHKAQVVEDYINHNLKHVEIEHIFIEQALMFFRRAVLRPKQCQHYRISTVLFLGCVSKCWN